MGWSFPAVNQQPYCSVRKMSTIKAKRDQRRDTILDVAGAIFAEEGFAATSMSHIAARLGGSKGTLYNYFKSKEDLFAAVVQEQCIKMADVLFDLDESRTIAETLTVIGERFIEHLMADWTVRMFRVVVAEASRTPELARTFYDAGPAQGSRMLTEILEQARARGEIVADDCELAAQHFMALCRGQQHLRCVLNLMPPLAPAEIKTVIAEAVRTFMARFGAPGAGAATEAR
jgi:AcrR family transcriptional regulator